MPLDPERTCRVDGSLPFNQTNGIRLLIVETCVPTLGAWLLALEAPPEQAGQAQLSQTKRGQ